MKKRENREENFMKENSIIFKKYKIKTKLGEGAFGNVYMGSCIENNQLVAIKVEPKKIEKPLLETEAFFLYSLKGLGIPEVLSFGRIKNYNVLVEPLLGKSLLDIFTERRKRLALEDICLIAIQIIERIQWVHSKNIVHRDIKPDNFLIGKKDPNIIYLIDFGLSKKFRSSKTGKHLRFGFTGKLTGTVRFASANALRGGEQSRRDDLESIAYMLIYFMRGKLPWQGVTGNKKIERYLKIYKMKKNVAPEDLCKSLPRQMTEFMRYVKQLEFEQDPDYNFLRNLFNSILKKKHETNEQLLFSWIRLDDFPNLKNPVNPATRRDSPQSRLYRKIQKKLDNEHQRNNSSDNDSGQKSFQTCTVTMNSNIGIIKNYNSKDIELETNNKKLKYKEGLNTMVTNLNQTLDENLVEDFEKPSSNDFSSINIMKNAKHKKKKNFTVNEIINYKNENGLSNFLSKKINSILISDKKIENNTDDKTIKQKIEKDKSTKEKNEKKEEDKNLKQINNKLIQENNNNKPTIAILENKLDNNINNENNTNINEKRSIYNNVNIENNNEMDINFKKNINVNIYNNKIDNINSSKKTNNNEKINRNEYLENNNKYNNIQNNIIIKENINNNINENRNKYNKYEENINKINLFENDNNENKINNLENKKYNKNNKLIKKLNNQNNNNQDYKDEFFTNINEQNPIEQNQNDFIQKNEKNNIQNLGNYISNMNLNIKKLNKKELIIDPNDEGPNNEPHHKQNFKKLNSQRINTMTTHTFEKNPSKNINNLTNSLRINNNINQNNLNNLNPNYIIKLKDKNIQINKKNNKNNNFSDNNNGYYKKNNDYIQNIRPHKINDLLPQNSDEIERNNNEDFFNDIKDLNQNNLRKINTNNINKKKTIINIGNISGNNTIKKINNNLNRNIRINSNLRYNQRNINDSNKNKTLPNFNENRNYNNDNNNFNNENNFKVNTKKIIINKIKNIDKINYNLNYSNINNNYNININTIPNDNNNIEFMNSFQNNKIRPKKSLLNDNIINGKNKINMNINNNINNNIIINNNINDSNIRNNSKNSFQKINNVNYILNKIPSQNIKNINSFGDLNQININKRPSYNIESNNNFDYLNQIGIDKRPSYNTNFNVSNFLNNKYNIPIYSYTQIKKLNSNLNNNFSKQMTMHKQNFCNGSNNIEKRNNFQERSLTFNNYRPLNNTLEENQIMKNNLINKINLKNSNMTLQPFRNLPVKSILNKQENFDMNFKNDQIINNQVFNLNEDNHKNRNISIELRPKSNLVLNINDENYNNFQINKNNPYSNDNIEFNNYKSYYE